MDFLGLNAFEDQVCVDRYVAYYNGLFEFESKNCNQFYGIPAALEIVFSKHIDNLRGKYR